MITTKKLIDYKVGLLRGLYLNVNNDILYNELCGYLVIDIKAMVISFINRRGYKVRDKSLLDDAIQECFIPTRSGNQEIRSAIGVYYNNKMKEKYNDYSDFVYFITQGRLFMRILSYIRRYTKKSDKLCSYISMMGNEEFEYIFDEYDLWFENEINNYYNNNINISINIDTYDSYYKDNIFRDYNKIKSNNIIYHILNLDNKNYVKALCIKYIINPNFKYKDICTLYKITHISWCNYLYRGLRMLNKSFSGDNKLELYNADELATIMSNGDLQNSFDIKDIFENKLQLEIFNKIIYKRCTYNEIKDYRALIVGGIDKIINYIVGECTYAKILN